MNPLYPIFKRLIVALLCLIAVNAVVSCEGYDDYAIVPMTIDEIIHWVEGDSVGEKTWK